MKSLEAIIRELAETVRAQERGTWKENLRDRWAPWMDELTYGVECRSGWQNLIEQMLVEIARAVGTPNACPELRITRICRRETFLATRFEGLDGNREKAVRRILHEAGDRSMQTCEDCGAPREPRRDDCKECTAECGEHFQ